MKITVKNIAKMLVPSAILAGCTSAPKPPSCDEDAHLYRVNPEWISEVADYSIPWDNEQDLRKDKIDTIKTLKSSSFNGPLVPSEMTTIHMEKKSGNMEKKKAKEKERAKKRKAMKAKSRAVNVKKPAIKDETAIGKAESKPQTPNRSKSMVPMELMVPSSTPAKKKPVAKSEKMQIPSDMMVPKSAMHKEKKPTSQSNDKAPMTKRKPRVHKELSKPSSAKILTPKMADKPKTVVEQPPKAVIRKTKPAAKPSTSGPLFYLHAGSFSKAESAETVKAEIMKAGFHAYTRAREVNGKLYHRVFIGPELTSAEIREIRKALGDRYPMKKHARNTHFDN